MTEKEISEIRRSLRPDRQALGVIAGCYVGANGEIITTFRETMGLLSEEETEKYCSILRRTLSGTPDRQLLDIAFENSQITDGAAEYALLSRLRASELSDTEAVDALFRRIAETHKSDDGYLILLTCNKYDVPHRSRDGLGEEDSTEVFTYLVCAVCPVKTTKSALTYAAEKKSFRHQNGASAVTAPELGFLFPCFDGRTANIYNALFYSKSLSDAHEDLTRAVFGQVLRMTPEAQGTTFRTVLAETLDSDCSLTVAKRLHAELSSCIEAHKEQKEEAPLAISKYQIKDVLESCGISEEKLDGFTNAYTEKFGAGTDLAPRNLVNPKQFELRTPDVVIKVSGGRSDLIETRVIDGVKYILVRANEGVELNGLDVCID